MAKDSYHIRPAYRRDIDIDALARLVLSLALQLAQEGQSAAEDDQSDEAAA